MDLNGTVGNDSVDHTPHRGGRPQTVEGLKAGEGTEGARRAERTTELSIPLLHITQPLCEQFDGNVFIVLQQVFLCHRPRKVDERVGVRGDPRNAPDHVSAMGSGSGGNGRLAWDVRVEQKHLFAAAAVAPAVLSAGEVEEFTRDTFFGGEDDAVFGEYAEDGACVRDGFHGIFDCRG